MNEANQNIEVLGYTVSHQSVLTDHSEAISSSYISATFSTGEQFILRQSETATETAVQDISIGSDSGIQFVVPLDDEEEVQQADTNPVAQAQDCNKDCFEKVFSRFQDYRCAVCMDNFEAEDVLHLLPCEHYFHCDCTTGWLADHNSCPICKVRVAASPQK